VVPNYDVTTWYGLYGPKGMPPAVIAKLNKALNEILQEPETRDRLSKTGVIVKSSTPEAWHQFMVSEYKKWTDVRVKSGLEQR
jgi:tripartite-type tricarboxylate transporter receptor subunit TctC